MPTSVKRPNRRDKIGLAVSIAVVVAIAAVVVVVLTSRGEHHPHGNPDLVPLADGAYVVADYNDCSDETDLGYIKNNLCIDFRLVQASRPETVNTFLEHETMTLDHTNCRLFSPADFGMHQPVIGRADLYGHDCVLLGPTAEVPFSMDDPDIRPVPKFWAMLRHQLTLAHQRPLPIIGVQTYPGPADDAEHRVC
jgi:hypothetical protein